MKKAFSFLTILIFSTVILIGQTKTGTLKIFSEFTGTVVFLDEVRQGEDVKQVDSVPVGSHYLKVMKDNVSIYSDLVNIQENTVTTVLVKNTGQVAEKILDSKADQRQEYQNKKLDILLTSNSITTTTGSSTLFPGYYSYWGISKSISNTQQISDWKIIQGGVKEISESEFADITEYKDLQSKINLQTAKDNKRTTVSALIAIPTVIMSTILLTDMVGKPWLHKEAEHPKWEGITLGVCLPVATISYLVCMKKPYSGHYTTVDDAANHAQGFNKKLKEKLGLPESYDLK